MNPLLEESIQLDFIDKPFYCWDTSFLGPERRSCCFNHQITLPQKEGEYKPLFPYQSDLYKKWESNKHIWIKKATGLGISEWVLRLMLWLCLRNNEYQGCQFCIVTGPNIDLAKKLIRRMRNMIKDYPGFRFDTETDYALEVNKCWIQAYPSHNLGSFRSLDKAKFIFLDEADFFPVGQLQDVRDVSERYIAKSNPWIVMVSTPNRPNGLFEQIELETDCLYERIHMPYTIGLNYIYTEKDIEKAKQSPSFEREYNLKYGWGIGNVFLPQDIDACCDLYKPAKINNDSSISMGIDPGFGSSRFGITILQLEDNILKVLYAKEFERSSYENMINEVTKLRYTYKPNKIYVDAAKPDFIKSLKIQFNETTNYEQIIADAKRDKADYEYRMYVIPISFNEYGRELLGRFQHVVSKKWFAISNIEHKELVVQMRSATFQENGNLNKSEAGDQTFDVFDSTRLALKLYELGEKRNGNN